MANPESPDDDGISAIDDESRDMLESEVKKGKARKFILVCKGAQIRSLVVFKKGPYGPRINRTRKSGFRGEFYCGVVTGKGVNLNLQLPGTQDVSDAMKAEGNVYDDVPCKIAKLRAFFAEEAGLKFKPEITIVTSLSDVSVVDENDEGVPEASSAASAVDTNGDAAAPSTASSEDLLKQKLLEALGKLTPLIKSSIAAAPNRKAELLQRAAAIRDAIQSDQLNDAKTDIVSYGKLLKQITAGNSAEAADINQQDSAPAVAGDNDAAEYERRLKSIMPNLKLALSSNGPLAGDIKTQATEAQGLHKQGQHKAALAALDELERLINEAQVKTPAAAAAVPDLAEKWQERLDAISPRYRDAIDEADNEYVKKLRVVYTYATEQAEAQQYTKALAALDRLEPILEDAEAAMASAADAADSAAAVQTGAEDFDTFRRCLSRWNSAVRDVRGQIETLKAAVLASYPDTSAAVDRLDEVFEGLDLHLENALSDGLTAPSAEQREAIAKQVQAIADKYQGIVDSNPMIEHADLNPFGVALSVQDTLQDPLEDMLAQLQLVA